MQKKNTPLHLPEGTFYVDVLTYDNSDRAFLKKVYTNWRSLCSDLAELESRGVNLPEGLSEASFCLEMNTVRVIGGISGANSSFDCYNPKTTERIQVKACSVIPDLTSFGPKSEWDKIYFVDFFRQGKWDGSFDIYLIDNSDIYNYPVNAGQTLKDQQLEGRRPRFSIWDGIIKRKGLKPVKTGML
ncbi:Bsp6I family type II restriction endonuclease [Chloroflexota bacterium]